jgi:hypothetical protein
VPSLGPILAFDPGGSTGWMYRGPEGGKLVVKVGELGHGDDSSGQHHLALWRLLARFHLASSSDPRGLTIVCERFQFRKEDAMQREMIELISREYEGIIVLYCKLNDIHLVRQNSAQAVGKTAFWGDNKIGNERIKTLGMWKANNVHAMDALRHFLYYVTFTLQNNKYILKLDMDKEKARGQ